MRTAYQADEGSAPSQVGSAFRSFDAASFSAVRRLALAAYVDSQRCPRCRRVLAERFDRLGSTLFSDDDPRELACSFDGADACTVRLLAACIVLFGRPRESVH